MKILKESDFRKLNNTDKCKVLIEIIRRRSGIYARNKNSLKRSGNSMNKNIKPTVYKILSKDRLAREDDWYLIQQVIVNLLPYNAGSSFGQVLQGMKVEGISFEAITRCRRKFMEEHPHLKVLSVDVVRKAEREKYYSEIYS